MGQAVSITCLELGVSESSALVEEFSRVEIPGPEIRGISSPPTCVETSRYGKYDLVSVVSGIELQSRSRGR